LALPVLPRVPVLAHEKLDVYQCAVKLLAEVSQVLDAMPPGTSVLRDQLERASLSVVANIAEAVGVRTPKERERHYGVARGSAMECGALLDACRLRGVCSLDQHQQAKQMLVRVVSMLTRSFRLHDGATAAGTRGEAWRGSSCRSSRTVSLGRDTA
jgi:four helix bundle protein